MEVSRSNLIEQLKKPLAQEPAFYSKADDEEILALIREVVKERPTYGYRRVHALVNGLLKEKKLKGINHKRVFRLMRQHHLLLQRPNRRPKRAHTGKVETLYSNTRWCSDGFSIQCLNGDRVHVAFSLDTCDREVMRYIASTIGVDGQMIRDLMLETVEYRFGQPKVSVPLEWLTDNGSCYTAKETVSFGRMLGLNIRTTPAYSPESNGMAEAFVKTFKRDYVYFGDLINAEAVLQQLPKWMDDYNNKAPHKALNMLSPREYLRKLKMAS
jgi:transposase InsO family protein